MKENMKSKDISNKDLRKIGFRWIYASQLCWNYERMMSTGYLYAMLPFLKKQYGDNPDEMKEMLKMHNQFYNTNPHAGHFILGIDKALEEKEGIDSKDVVAGIKTGLMGPFAGVGDTIFGVLIPTIFGSIAAYMGLQGNGFGVILWMLVNIIVVFLRLAFTPIGYRQGEKLINQYREKLNALTDSAILLGVTVVGALIPTVINAKSTFTYQQGEVKFELQSILDQIMPSLIPVCLVGLVYYILGKKNMTSAKAIIFVMLLSILLYNLKILG
ncbi:PTS system mannose/fructose/sorbose family transporter subunit IID [Helcococcus kunzii]|uniref:PTS system mannose/fructose/sorbose family transporter subunit IID n=1 Tax=Helcococcus kunzii TaxID=40091 RepID=UPI0038AB557B